jgi:GAF domain-containing protein
VDESYQRDIDAVMRIEAVPLILDVISRVSGMGFAAVARVTEDRWIACSVLDHISFGLTPGGELDVKTTICDEIRLHSKPVVIDDVLSDPVYCQHHTPQKYGFRSYVSMPIFLKDGSFFGTLCAIDPRPNKPSRPEVLGMFQLFAKMIGGALDAELRFATSEQYRLDQEEIHRLRDQFIAVLGHDLRNPLASIDAGTRALSRSPLDERATTVVALMQRSVKG